MTTDQPDTDPRNALVHALVHATMPDGSPISSWVKAETILCQLGFTGCPSTLAQLIAVGVSEKARFAKQRWTREEAKRRAREICAATNPAWAKVQERGLPDSRYKLCNSTDLPDDTQI